MTDAANINEMLQRWVGELQIVVDSPDRRDAIIEHAHSRIREEIPTALYTGTIDIVIVTPPEIIQQRLEFLIAMDTRRFAAMPLELRAAPDPAPRPWVRDSVPGRTKHKKGKR